MMSEHATSFALAVGLGTTKFMADAAGSGIESTNLIFNAVGAVLLAVVAFYLKEDRKAFQARLMVLEEQQGKLRDRQDRHERRVLRVLIHNEYQTPILTKMAGTKPLDVERELRKIEEPDSPSDV